MFSSELEILNNCNLCPRNCRVNRLEGYLGYCNTDADFNIASICLHRGEEPILGGENGICNVFFSHCNLQCSYCQNHQISNNAIISNKYKKTLEQTVDEIVNILDNKCDYLGFVSPSHVIPQMLCIIKKVKERGNNPIIVYNTNCYDNVDKLKQLEGIVDIYLPDFKYMDSHLAKSLSEAENYPQYALAALKEMYYQKGASILYNEEGYAISGLIIRHLVLPSKVENSIKVLQTIDQELSSRVFISLMSQYNPTPEVKNHNFLNRNLLPEEYNIVLQELDNLGFYNGLTQELSSYEYYNPDFEKLLPFD